MYVFDDAIRILSAMRHDLMTETEKFLDDGGSGDISDIELSFGGRRVSIPLMMPETNEATTEYFERLISILKSYQED